MKYFLFEKDVYSKKERDSNSFLKRKTQLLINVAPIPEKLTKPNEASNNVEDKLGKLATMKMKSEIVFDDHLIPLDEFLVRYTTKLDYGLDSKTVDDRQQRDGKNILPQKKGENQFVTYLKELFGGFNILMWFASFLCFICWKPLGEPHPDNFILILAIILAVSVICQSTFSFYQQYQTDNLMASFEKLMPHKTTVLRNGAWETVNTWELVVGDIVQLTAGDKIPADLRITACNQASVETSSLTGESEPVKVSTTQIDSNPYETNNIVFFGSMMVEGTLTGVVFQVGKNTVMAKIADLTQSTKKDMSTMEREVNLFAIFIGCLAVLCFLVTFFVWLGIIRVQHPFYMTYSNILVACMSCLVSVVPVGLQTAVTMTLTLVAKKMKSVNVLVKKLSIIETLGSTTVIASDKTGTITQNKMKLANIFICGHQTKNLIEDTNAAISEIYYLMMKFTGLCNKAIVEHPNREDRVYGENQFIGSPTECGILKSIMRHVPVEKIRSENPTVFEIPFNSRYKYHVSVHRLDQNLIGPEFESILELMHGNTHLLIMKGKPLGTLEASE